MGSCKNFFVRMNFNSHHRLKLIYQSLAGIRTGARKGEKILGEGCNTFFTKLARVWGLPENSTFSVLGKSLQNCFLLRCVPTKKIKMLSSLVSLRWRTTPSRRHQWRHRDVISDVISDAAIYRFLISLSFLSSFFLVFSFFVCSCSFSTMTSVTPAAISPGVR